MSPVCSNCLSKQNARPYVIHELISEIEYVIHLIGHQISSPPPHSQRPAQQLEGIIDTRVRDHRQISSYGHPTKTNVTTRLLVAFHPFTQTVLSEEGTPHGWGG